MQLSSSGICTRVNDMQLHLKFLQLVETSVIHKSFVQRVQKSALLPHSAI
jgi:hypothetical protein